MASSGVKMISINKTGNLNYQANKIDNDAQLAAKWGRNTVQKRNKSLPNQNQFQTRSYKTQNSNWTPIVHRPSNEKIFLERRDLVSNWFELWTDSQRKKFLDKILQLCARSQLYFVQQWFDLKVPLKHVDFTNVLPKFLSLYIFSFLDPRSLCRATQVSSHWKFLTEQDELWVGKCIKRGWYLPYTPANNEYGAWKIHYISCTSTLDMDGPNMERVYGRFGTGTNFLKRQKTDLRMLVSQTYKDYNETLHSRPPWLPPDAVPKDLEITNKAMLRELNPNDPIVPPALTLHHNKFGIHTGKFLAKSMPNVATVIDYGLKSSLRMSENRINKSEDIYDFNRRAQQIPLSQSLNIESYEEKRMMELVKQPWEPPIPRKSPVKTGVNLSTGGNYPMIQTSRNKLNYEQAISKTFPHEQHPRIIFISSRIPGADLLVDAVLFGVIPIVYEYEGTSLEALLEKLLDYLQGRCAKSIGLFTHGNDMTKLNLVLGATLTTKSIEDADISDFMKTLGTNIVTAQDGGHLDFFSPLAASENGVEILTKLSYITGTLCTSPTGIVGNYNHVNTEWIHTSETTHQPNIYFCKNKLFVWSNVADQVTEGSKRTREILSGYIQQQNKDICSQITGEIIYNSTGLLHLRKLNETCQILQEGLLQLSQLVETNDSESSINPLKFLGTFILNRSSDKNERSILKVEDTIQNYNKLEDNEYVESSFCDNEIINDDKDYNEIISEANKDKEVESNIEEDIEVIEDKTPTNFDVLDMDKPGITLTQIVKEPSSFKPIGRNLSNNFDLTPTKSHKLPKFSEKNLDTNNIDLYLRIPPPKLTSDIFLKIPDKRTAIAREVLSTETEFRRCFGSLKKVYLLPLKSALANNKAILSASNLQMIFADAMNILDLSRSLLDDLRKRFEDWDSSSCLGDLFIKFCGQLKVYTNFLQNYSMILHCIEKSVEQIPNFRAFLNNTDKTPSTMMLTIQELLLLPTRRIDEYIILLTWFQRHTPVNHADRSDLELSLKLLRDLSRFINEQRTQCEREQQIIILQKKILNCPSLMEANRYFIKQLDVSHLRAPFNNDKVSSLATEFKVFQHIEDLGLFLFNDSVVVTKRTSQHFPYERRIKYSYRFIACSSLNRLRFEDVGDSKYVCNCFLMQTPKRMWYCKTSTRDEKINWINIVENAIRAAVEEN